MPNSQQFVLCIDSGGTEDLKKGNVYRWMPDNEARSEGMLRVIDESNEDYLYPAE
jgi:hypothetical protein